MFAEYKGEIKELRDNRKVSKLNELCTKIRSTGNHVRPLIRIYPVAMAEGLLVKINNTISQVGNMEYDKPWFNAHRKEILEMMDLFDEKRKNSEQKYELCLIEDKKREIGKIYIKNVGNSLQYEVSHPAKKLVKDKIILIQGCDLYLMSKFEIKQCEEIKGNAIILTNENTAYFIFGDKIFMKDGQPQAVEGINRQKITLSESTKPIKYTSSEQEKEKIVNESTLRVHYLRYEIPGPLNIDKLKPFLPQILEITAARGHTQNRPKSVVDAFEEIKNYLQLKTFYGPTMKVGGKIRSKMNTIKGLLMTTGATGVSAFSFFGGPPVGAAVTGGVALVGLAATGIARQYGKSSGANESAGNAEAALRMLHVN